MAGSRWQAFWNRGGWWKAVLAAAVYIAVYQLIGLVQCFLVIGLARIVFTLAYIRTKNILVCFGAHLLTDWGIFTASLVFT